MMSANYQHDDIAKIAYRSWLERGQPDGSPEIDWYYAVSVITNPEEINPVSIDGFTSSGTEAADEQFDSDVGGTEVTDADISGISKEVDATEADESSKRAITPKSRKKSAASKQSERL